MLANTSMPGTRIEEKSAHSERSVTICPVLFATKRPITRNDSRKTIWQKILFQYWDTGEVISRNFKKNCHIHSAYYQVCILLDRIDLPK